MRRALSYVRRLVLALGTLLVLTVVGIGVFTQTERFRDLLRTELVSILNASFQGEISVGRIEGSLWGSVTLDDLLVRYQGVDILRVPRLTARYSLLPLLQSRVEVSHLEGFDPVVQLVQDTAGKWNVLEAFSSPVPEEESTEGFGLAVFLNTVVLRRATIDLRLAGADRETYHFTETDLHMGMELLPAGLTMQVNELLFRLAVPNLAQLRATASLTYQDTESPATLQVTTLQVDTGQSQVQFAGGIRNFDTMEIDGVLSLTKLAVGDLVQLFPEWPVKKDLAGTLQVSGPLADLRGKLALTAAQAHVTADLQADLSQDSPRYQGTFAVARLDVPKLLGEGTVAGVVDGTVRASGVGTALAGLRAEGSMQVKALRVGSWQVGNVSITSSLAHEIGRLSGIVSGGLGRATWQGEIYLAEEPRYELGLSVERLDITKVAAGQEPVGGELNLKGMIKGRGTTLPKMEARAEFDLLPSTVGSVEVERGRLAASIAEGRVQIAEATLAAKDTTLAVQGEIGTALEEQGRLSYTLRMGEISPWFSLVDQRGSGSLTLTGEVKGNIADLQIAGELQAHRLNVQEISIQRTSLAFDLRKGERAWPQGTLAATLAEVQAGVELRTVEASVTLPDGQSQVAQVAVLAQETNARTHRLKAEVSAQPQQIAAQLSVLSLELPDGVWQLSQPARIVQSTAGVAIQQLTLVNRDQQILLDGNLSLTGEQNLLCQIDRLALADFRPLLPEKPAVRGLLSARVQVNGTAAAPDIAGSANVTNLQISGQEYGELSLEAGYREKLATLEVTFQQDAQHTLDAAGTLPLTLSWAHGWEVGLRGDLDLHVRSVGLSLAFLNALSGESVEDVNGELSVDMRLQGPMSQPVPRGTLRLREGQVKVLPLGVRVSAITIAIEAGPEIIRIEQMAAKARKGQIQGSGTIALQGYMPKDLSVVLTADRWPAIHTSRYKAEIGGEVRGEGPLTAPRVSGRLEVLKATLRPDLAFLEEKPVTRDATIVVLPPAGSSQQSTADAGGGQTQAVAEREQQNLTLDLTIAVQRNTWVKQENASVELAGTLQVTKEAGKNMDLVGTIEVVRGWVGFQGRRFTLSQGQVVFTGGEEIDPALDVVAQYRTSQYLVEAVVGGTAEQPSLHLRSDPALDQADILAVLLFGKPTTALGEGEKLNLQQQALAITSGYAASKIGEAVSQSLGLDRLGVDLSELDYSGGRIGFGQSLTRNLHVSASQELTKKGRKEVTVQYQLSPNWEITTSTSSSGHSGAGILWHKDY